MSVCHLTFGVVRAYAVHGLGLGLGRRVRVRVRVRVSLIDITDG